MGSPDGPPPWDWRCVWCTTAKNAVFAVAATAGVLFILWFLTGLGGM